jgi:uncharacterized protein YyaL (SSP411 family)
MIAAFARAARVLRQSPDAGAYERAAARAAQFIRTTLWLAGDRTLLRRYRDGEAAIPGYAEDYAYLAWGVLELFQTTGDAEWLQWAMELQARQDELFWDDQDGGWFSTTGTDPSVLLRLKEDYDGAEPAASSVAASNVLVLAHLIGDEGHRRKAERTLARYGRRIGAAARVIPMMMCALAQWHAPSMQLVVVGGRTSDRVRELEQEIAAHYLPFAVHVPVDPGTNQDALKQILPFVDGMQAHGGGAVYACRDFTCRQPVSTVEALRAELP